MLIAASIAGDICTQATLLLQLCRPSQNISGSNPNTKSHPPVLVPPMSNPIICSWLLSATGWTDLNLWSVPPVAVTTLAIAWLLIDGRRDKSPPKGVAA